MVLWLHTDLQSAIDWQKYRIYRDNLQHGGNLTKLSSISLDLLDKGTHFSYGWAIALQLATPQQHSPREIAVQIAQDLAQLSEIEVGVKDNGWIELDLSDRIIAHWLQAGTQNPLEIHSSWHSLSIARPDREREFLWQYAHARCCSLLNAGDRDRLIALAPVCDETNRHWSAIAPIPWLASNGQLQLTHPAERRLIYQLLKISDILSLPVPKQPERLAPRLIQTLVEAFLSFERACQIWGAVKAQNPHLAVTRLGLVLLVQQRLQDLLATILGIPTPFRL